MQDDGFVAGSTGDGPATAIVIEELPFSTSGDSSGFLDTVPLGGGPDVFFSFTSETGVRQITLDNSVLWYFW